MRVIGCDCMSPKPKTAENNFKAKSMQLLCAAAAFFEFLATTARAKVVAADLGAVAAVGGGFLAVGQPVVANSDNAGADGVGEILVALL